MKQWAETFAKAFRLHDNEEAVRDIHRMTYSLADCKMPLFLKQLSFLLLNDDLWKGFLCVIYLCLLMVLDALSLSYLC